VRRLGGANAEDHANGVYELHDRVQVSFQGQWVDSEVVTILGSDYQVTLPGNRLVWANTQQLRYIGSQVKAVVARPAPRLSPDSPAVTVNSTGATARADSQYEEVECWTGGGKIYLHKPGEKDDMVLDINNDGTLDSPMGELKKKG